MSPFLWTPQEPISRRSISARPPAAQSRYGRAGVMRTLVALRTMAASLWLDSRAHLHTGLSRNDDKTPEPRHWPTGQPHVVSPVAAASNLPPRSSPPRRAALLRGRVADVMVQDAGRGVPAQPNRSCIQPHGACVPPAERASNTCRSRPHRRRCSTAISRREGTAKAPHADRMPGLLTARLLGQRDRAVDSELAITFDTTRLFRFDQVSHRPR